MAAIPPPGSTFSEQDVRAILLYEYRLGSSEAAVLTRINQVTGEGFVSETTVRQWFQRFKAGSFSLREKRTAAKDLNPKSRKKPRLVDNLSLDGIDDFLLKQVVRKFSLPSGINFYRSCRQAIKLVLDTKPIWELSYLSYANQKRFVVKDWIDDGAINRITNLFSAEKFCRVNRVDVSACNSNFIRATVVPQLRDLGAVGLLDVVSQRLSKDDMQALLKAAKPDSLRLEASGFCLASAVYKNVKNLEVKCDDTDVQSFWTTGKVFEVARNFKTTLRLNFGSFCKDVISSFIENWQRGESTGSLEKLTVQMGLLSRNRTGNIMANAKEIETMMAGFVKIEKDYFLKRRGRDRLRIRLIFTMIASSVTVEFYFS